jgi:hypothetical protein
MKLSRRNVLAGLGGLAVGGGALLGSGAFSSVEASRDVEVNVLTELEIGEDDLIADVLVDVGSFGSVAVTDGGPTGVSTDGTDYFPDSGGYSSPSYGNGYVSLIENDVTIIFGPSGEELPPNSTVDFTDLFALVNANGSETTLGHSLSFDSSGFSNPDTDVSFESAPTDVPVAANTGVDYSVDVTTDDSDDTATGALTITID